MKNFNENLVKGESQNNMHFNFTDYSEVKGCELKNSDYFNAIKIESRLNNLNVTVSKNGGVYVEARLHGRSKCPEGITFDAYVDKRVLHIVAYFKPGMDKGDVTLEVTVPQKVWSSFYIISNKSNINLEGIEAERIEIVNVEGDTEVRDATYKLGMFTTLTGWLELITKAQDCSETKLLTISGEVLAQFLNVGEIEFDLKEAQGSFYNCHVDEDGYEAKVSIRSVSGTVLIG